MTALPPDSDAALEPVRRTLRAAAEQKAAELRDDAVGQTGALLTAARAEAAAIMAAAVKEGEEAARSVAARRSAQARREAHELVLARRTSLRLELQRRVQKAAAGITSDPRYPDLVARLTAQCRQLLGPNAHVSESPSGGVVAEAGPRRLDLSLPVLAEMALDAMPEARELWTR